MMHSEGMTGVVSLKVHELHQRDHDSAHMELVHSQGSSKSFLGQVDPPWRWHSGQSHPFDWVAQVRFSAPPYQLQKEQQKKQWEMLLVCIVLVWLHSASLTCEPVFVPPVCASKRFVAMASISSMKMMAGAFSLASRKTSLTIRGPSPRYFWTNSEPTTRINAARNRG